MRAAPAAAALALAAAGAAVRAAPAAAALALAAAGAAAPAAARPEATAARAGSAGAAPAAGATPAACRPGLGPDPRVPTWAAVAGFPLGSRPATGAELDRYLARVDAASPRVRVLTAGRSAAGRPLRYALVSRPAALAPRRLAALRRRLAAVVQGRLSPAAARRLARDERAVVWIAGSVHGNEPSGGDADAALLYELAARRDCAAARRLARLVVALMPVQNPDGRAAGTRVSAAGFDLNRDWVAATQPETVARLATLRRLPPLAFVDQHEQGGTLAFAPPYADPVHHEIAAGPLRAMDATFGPAVRRALAAGGWDLQPAPTLDLFFPGYGDSATTLLFGAAGMTVEAGFDDPFAQRVAQQAAAARAVVDAAAAGKARLVRAWAAVARQARAQGARGALEANVLTRPGGRVRFRVPGERVLGYAIRADRAAADAAFLVARLLAAGVRVERLRAAARVARLRPFAGGPARPATLPRGTFVVPMAQGAKHWVQALLGPDAHVAFPYISDVSAWSPPLLMGLGGAAVASALPPRASRVPLRREPGVASPTRRAPAYAFAGDAADSLGLGLELLAAGARVLRDPRTGGLAATGVRDLAQLRAAAVRHATAIRPLAGGAPAAARPLRAPRVALLAGDGPPATAGPGRPQPSPSPAWASEVLRRRFGLPFEVVSAADVGAGRLAIAGSTHLVVPDGAPAAGLPAAAPQAVGAFVRAGGTYVGWRSRGIDLAAAAGITGARRDPEIVGLRVPGTVLAIELSRSSPLALGVGGRAVVLDEGDPVMRAPAGVAGRFPPAGRAARFGYAEGTGALAGTAAVVDEGAGAGRTVLFSFDPAFRGYARGTERLLANALLTG